MPRSDITGFVLAGGRSQRMGRDKAQIDWNGRSLLAHAVEQMRQVTESVWVVGKAAVEDSPAPILPDVISGAGPLAGIHTALTFSNTDWNLILAVDLPLVTGELLNLIVRYCDNSSNLAVVPRVGARLHPLCGAYHRVLLADIEQALGAGERSIHRLLERLNAGIMKQNTSKVGIIEQKELSDAGFAAERLLNLNTPADLEQARKIAKNLNV